MITNKEKAYRYIQQKFFKEQKLDQNNGVNTEEVANYLQTKRPNASAMLNQLVKEKLLTKTKTRPVKYRLSDQVTHDAFDQLIGSKGSLADAVKQAKAAILYPSGMLPLQIIAEPGSGSTYFSKAIIEYAKDKNVLPRKASYHEINCIITPDINKALFGSNSGDSFLTRYQNSVIMINHYEKLTSAQVYQINHLIDQTSNLKHNLVLFSTILENKDLIRTSIKIVLPNLNDRPLSEKLGIIQNLFDKQAKSAKKAIVVSSQILLGLAIHKYKQGFKELEKVIVFASAKAYLRSLDDLQEQEFITKSDFPNNFIFGKTLNIEQSLKVKTLLQNHENYVFEGDKSNTLADYNEKYEQKLYQSISQNYQNLAQEGLEPRVIEKSVFERIESLYNKYGFHINEALRHQENEYLTELGKLVTTDLIKMTRKFLNHASAQLNREFDQNIFYGLCLHLNSIIKLNSKSEHTLTQREIASLKMEYPQELALTRKFVSQIKEKFHYTFSENETMVLLTFLVESRTKEGKPVILFAMHGNGAAHYISEVTNALNHAHNSYAYDMQLDKNLNIVFKELKNLICKINQGAGVIVIYDMGSFKEIFERIIDETQIPIRLLNIPITLIGLEVSRKALLNTNIDDVYHNVISNMETYNHSQINNKQNMIITLCHTGEGGAIQLRDYINQYSHLGWLVKPMSISNREKLAKNIQEWRKTYNIKEFIGTYNPNLFGIPFIPIAKIFENSHDNLDRILNFLPIKTTTTVYDQVYNYYEKQLKYVQVSLLKETMPQVLDQLTEQYHLSEDVQIGLFTHIVGILESGLSGEPRQNIKLSATILNSLKIDFKFIEHALRPVERAFNFLFNDSEIYTIIAIIKKL